MNFLQALPAILAGFKGLSELFGGGDEAGDLQGQIGKLLLSQYQKQQQLGAPLMAAAFPAIQARMGQRLPVRGVQMPAGAGQGFNPFGRTQQTAQRPTGSFLTLDQLLRSQMNPAMARAPGFFSGIQGKPAV